MSLPTIRPLPMIRLFSLPGRGHENRYFDLMLDALEVRGVRVVPTDIRHLLLLRFDVLHLNFPTHYVTQRGPIKAAASSALFAGVFLLASLFRRRIVYTVHDVTPLSTRNEWLLWRYYAFVCRCVDGYVFLSASSRVSFLERFTDQASKPWRLAPHGPYPADLMCASERADRHDAMAGIGALLVGFLGVIKPYKNVAALAHLPEQLADGRRVHLVVAGPAEAGQEAAVEAALANRSPSGVTRLPVRLSDRELDLLMQSVDVVLLPYQNGSNSGAALLVLSNRGRLIGSTLPIFRELAGEVGTPWVLVSEDTPGGWQSTLEQVAAQAPDMADQLRLDRYLETHSFAAGADAIMSLYEALRA